MDSSGAMDEGDGPSSVKRKIEAGIDNESPKLSKKAQKRLKRDEEWASKRLEKRHAYKERKRERALVAKEEARALKKQNEKDGEEVELTEEDRAVLRSQRKGKLEERQQQFVNKANGNFTVIIDCNWDDIHVEKAFKSLSQQILQCYGKNRRSENPANLYLTGVSDTMMSHLDKNNVKLWNATHVEAKDYIDLPQFKTTPVDAAAVAAAAATNSVRPKQLVYLSSDAEETLEELDENCAYIIGGIVDRNQFKGVAHKKAEKQNVRTVKLPIKEHISLCLTHVLTVNHVFELLLERCRLKSWPAALEKVIPQRKVTKTVQKEEVEEEGQEQQQQKQQEQEQEQEMNDTDADSEDDRLDEELVDRMIKKHRIGK
jgi:tRNA (guanine9-N1)-methyltransferase